MARNPLIKRYLDAGMAFTQMTQAKAEAIVKDLVKAGEVQAQKTEELVGELLDRSRENTEKLLDLVRAEVVDQLDRLGVVSKSEPESPDPDPKASPPKKAAKKATKKKAATKKAATKKAATKKAATKKKSAAKKRPAKKRAAKKSAGGSSTS